MLGPYQSKSGGPEGYVPNSLSTQVEKPFLFYWAIEVGDSYKSQDFLVEAFKTQTTV